MIGISDIRFKNDFYIRQLRRVADLEDIFRMMDGQTILITGASGMLGLCIIDVIASCNRMLNTQIHIKAMSRNEDFARKRAKRYWEEDWFEYYAADCREALNPEEIGHSNIVIHCADNLGDSSESYSCSVDGGKNLLEYAKKTGVSKYAMISTAEVYGNKSGNARYYENDLLEHEGISNLFGGIEGKRVAENYLINDYDRNISKYCFRLAKIYGPTAHEKSVKAINMFIRLAAENEWIVIRDAKNPVYSYLYVTDAAFGILAGIMKVPDEGKCEIYNLSNPRSEIAIRDLGKYLSEKYTSYSGHIRFETDSSILDMFSEVTECRTSTEKLEKTGWYPRVSLEDGVDSSVNWARKCLKYKTEKTKKTVKEIYKRVGWEKIYIHRIDKHISKFPIFFFWWQGEKNLPEICRICLESIRANILNCDTELIIITKHNIMEYVKLTPNIIEKHESGIMTTTHFSDILRCELLYRYGGLWVDATILVTKKIPDEFFMRKELYTFRGEKAWSVTDVCDGRFSGFIWSVPYKGSRLFERATRLFYAYWNEYDYLVEYYLINYFLTIIAEEDETARYEIESNKDTLTIHPGYFMGIINEAFDINEWKRITGDSLFLKLQRRFSVCEKAENGKQSYWGYLKNVYL